ncbi:MAG TPA: TRAP transporter substrate-binding protein [Methylomirabilota bacterium]|jgi:tripartite ATP-independent transporter DctP family solute receptor|nr:TRAP transporter substrate-binding protein [Methylomirabilota bacterium]
MARLIVAVFTAVLLLPLALPDRAAAQQVIRLGHVGFPGSLFDIVAAEYAKKVNEALKGKVEMRVFHSSQLGTDEQMIKGIKVGAPEMFIPSTIMSTVEQKYGVFEMPYIIVSRAHMKKVAEHREVTKALFDPLPKQGVRVIGVWENGFRHITNNVRPIVKPEDLKGVKLRVPSGVWRVKMFKAYGANPSPMAFAEVYSALQQGVMDGQENPLAQIWSGKFHEVQKHISMTGHVYSPAYILVSESFWQKLPPDQRQVIEAISAEMGDYARTTGERLDRELLEKMTAAGKIKVNEADKEAFIKASAPIYQEFGTEVAGGSDLIKLIQSLR